MRLSDSPKGLLHEGMPSVKHDLGRTRDIKKVLPQCYLKASTWGMKWPIMFCYMSKMSKDSLRRHSTIKVKSNSLWKDHSSLFQLFFMHILQFQRTSAFPPPFIELIVKVSSLGYPLQMTHLMAIFLFFRPCTSASLSRVVFEIDRRNLHWDGPKPTTSTYD